jgi:probable F420-dependent oxidoreductase
MRVGVNFFPTAESIDPVTLGRALEERGFDALFLAEHSHVPSSRVTPWGGREDAPPLPDYYASTMDSFVVLSAVAVTTSELVIGTGISLVAQHDPIWLAKQVATLDHLSGGRLVFGIGYGWNREELASHGVAFGDRRDVVAEKIKLMKALWTQDEASYEGQHVRLEPSWAWPKPLQRPHPPIILGSAAGPKTFAALADYCDGWMPIVGRGEIGGSMATLRAELEKADRDPDTFQLMAYMAPADPDQWAEWEDLGMSRVLLHLPSLPTDAALAWLDEHSRYIT